MKVSPNQLEKVRELEAENVRVYVIGWQTLVQSVPTDESRAVVATLQQLNDFRRIGQAELEIIDQTKSTSALPTQLEVIINSPGATPIFAGAVPEQGDQGIVYRDPESPASRLNSIWSQPPQDLGFEIPRAALVSALLFALLGLTLRLPEPSLITLADTAERILKYDGVVLLVSMLGFGGLSLYLGKDMMWDLYNYHYYNAYAFLHGRVTFDYAPAQLQSYLNPVLDLPFYVLTCVLPDWGVGFVMGALHGLDFWLIFRITVLLLSSYTSLRRGTMYFLSFLCAAAGMFSSMGIGTLGTTTNDLFCSVLVLAALYSLLRYLAKGSPLWVLMMSGWWLGFAVGAKLTAAMYAPPMALILVLNWRRLREKLKPLLAYGMAGAVGLLAPSGYWMSVLYRKFGNPIFPFYNTVFHSDYWLPSDFGHTRFLGHDIKYIILFPYYVLWDPQCTAEVDFFDMRILLGLLLLAVLVAVGMIRFVYRAIAGRPPAVRGDEKKRVSAAPSTVGQFVAMALAVFFAGSYALWLKEFACWRQMVVLEVLAPTVMLGAWLILLRTPSVAVVAALWCLVPVLATMRPADWGRGAWSGGAYFQIKPPVVATGEDVLAIMIGLEPYSHVVPFCPGNVRFVRIQSNIDFFRVAPNGTDVVETRLQQEMRQIVREHGGPIYLLAPTKDLDTSPYILKEYGLEKVPGPGMVVDAASEIEWMPLRKLHTE
jgi:hypothetical protein